MIYLIGGVPRSGKTLLARKVAEVTGARYMSLDDLRQTLEHIDPELGIKTGNDAELNAGRMWEPVKILIGQEVQEHGGCVIEGADLQPMLARELIHNPHIRMLFLGYGSISVDDKMTAIRAYLESKDWANSISAKKLREIVAEEIARSARFQKQCTKVGIKYFDTGSDFAAGLNKALAHLTNKPT